MHDYGVSTARVLALFMILICHLGTRYGVGFIAELFVIGVEVFFFISGYLSYAHNKNYSVQWFLKRLIRLFMPIAVFSLIIIIIAKLICSDVSIAGLQHCALGYYGLSKILPGLSFHGMDGFQHLWFVTVIILCYLGLPLVSRLREKLNSLWSCIAVLLLIQLILAAFNVRFSYFTVFYSGWLFKAFDFRLDSVKKTVYLNLVLIVSFALRLACRMFFDKTWLYLQLVIPLTNGIDALCIFCDVYAFINLIGFGRKDSLLRRTVEWLEGISYEVYLVHYVFIEGFLNVFNLHLNEALKVIIFFGVSFVAAWLVNLICRPLNNYTMRLFSAKG